MYNFYIEDFLPGGIWWQNTIVFGVALIIFLISLYFKISEYREIGRLKKLIEAFPGYADLRCKLAEIYIRRGQMNEAIHYYEKAVEIYPLFTKARLRLGELYELQGKRAVAAEHYRALFNSLPEDEPLRHEIRKKLLF